MVRQEERSRSADAGRLPAARGRDLGGARRTGDAGGPGFRPDRVRCARGRGRRGDGPCPYPLDPPAALLGGGTGLVRGVRDRPRQDRAAHSAGPGRGRLPGPYLSARTPPGHRARLRLAAGRRASDRPRTGQPGRAARPADRAGHGDRRPDRRTAGRRGPRRGRTRRSAAGVAGRAARQAPGRGGRAARCAAGQPALHPRHPAHPGRGAALGHLRHRRGTAAEPAGAARGLCAADGRRPGGRPGRGGGGRAGARPAPRPRRPHRVRRPSAAISALARTGRTGTAARGKHPAPAHTVAEHLLRSPRAAAGPAEGQAPRGGRDIPAAAAGRRRNRRRRPGS